MPVKEVYVLAYGPLGLKPWELAPLRFSDFLLMVEGQNRKEELQWLHTRELLTMIHNTSMGANRRIKPTDIIKLSMDKVEVASKQGEEEFMRMLIGGAGVKVDSTGGNSGEMAKPQNN